MKKRAFLTGYCSAGTSRRRNPILLLVAVLAASLLGSFAPAGAAARFAPGFPGKKGPKFAQERHSFKPKLLLPPSGTFGVSGIPVRPDTVHLKLLAIRIDFPGTPFVNQKPWIDRHILFASQFYYVASGGLLQLEPVVTDTVFTMPKPMAEYGQDDDLGFRLVELARDAVAACDSAIDFSKYDEIFLIHSGQGQEADVSGDSPEEIWSASLGPAEFEYYMPDTTGAGHVGIATNDTLSGGETRYITQLVVAPEDESQDGWFFSPLGVYVHEFGHLLGLPDLYDTEGEVTSQGIGNWGLMGTGLWNANGYFPAEPEAWSKAAMGWKAVRVLSSPGDYALSYSEGANPAGEIGLVPLGGREYYLIENRLKDPNGNGMVDYDDVGSDRVFNIYVDSYAGAEFDFYLPEACDTCAFGAGLLVWHIDEQQIEARAPYNKVNADAFHKGVDLEEADGIQDLDRTDYSPESYGSRYDGFYEGNNTSFTPVTNPNTDGSYGGKSYVYIENIGPVGQSMSLGVDFGARQGSWPVVAQSRFGTNHPNAADLNDDGAAEIIACDEGGHLYVMNGDGTPYASMGGQLKALGDSVFSSPAVGDIDGDGKSELVVVSAAGRVFAWNGEDMTEVRDGDSNPATDGVLVDRSDVGRTAVALADFDDDGSDDIFFGASLPDRVLVPGDSLYPFYDIRVLPDSIAVNYLLYPAQVGRAPLVADLGGNEGVVVLIPMGSGDGSGRLESTAGLTVCEGTIPGPPTLICRCVQCQVGGLETEVTELVAGDIDRDGLLEIVAADVAGYVHAVKMSVQMLASSGVPLPLWEVHELPGWPVQLADSAVAGISLGEINGDGRLEVLATCEGRAFALNYHGTRLTGWPPELPMRPYGFGKPHGPLCADVSGDGAAEYVGTVSDSRLLAISGDGTTLPGWPIVAGSPRGVSPALADVDSDGLTELVIVRDVGVNDSLQGEIDVVELGVAADAASAWWPSYRRDPAHSGVIPDSVAVPAPAAQKLVRKVFAMPNPVRGETAELHYELAAGVDRVSLKIYDLSGRLVHEASPAVYASSDNVYALDVTDFAPAVYLFSVEASGQGGRTEKMFSRVAVIK